VLSQFERAERTVFVTARDGAVQVTIDEHGHLQVFYYRDRKWNLANRNHIRPVQNVTQLIGGSGSMSSDR
jgi:hypothetical protein